ncbi:type IV pilus modification protein PilV [Marinobacteraceae bacterium S3BR75-40.1]
MRIKQHGFTMIEVLIAMVILAIGLLGVAGVQSLSLKSANNSNTRSLITMHAGEIVERMRANMPGVEDGQYNSITAAGSGSSCSPSCSPAQLASRDAYEWITNLQQDVPSAQAKLTYSGGMAVVTIDWTERDLGNDAVKQSYTLRARIDQ